MIKSAKTSNYLSLINAHEVWVEFGVMCDLWPHQTLDDIQYNSTDSICGNAKLSLYGLLSTPGLTNPDLFLKAAVPKKPPQKMDYSGQPITLSDSLWARSVCLHRPPLFISSAAL